MDGKKLEPKKLFSPFSIFALVVFSSAIISNFYFFYFQKNYEFIVESPCDTDKEECFQRDCSNPDDCPPNGLSDFKRYSLNANDFQYCVDEDCTEACESSQIKCEQIACTPDEEFGESCSSPVLESEEQISGKE